MPETQLTSHSPEQGYSQRFFEEFDDLRTPAETPTAPAKRPHPKQPSKKEQIISLYKKGGHDILQLAQQLTTRPSYVATVLQAAGLISGYYDLYTSTGNDQNIYSKFFRNVLSFKSPTAARESVERIDGLYRYFESIGDRAGQHHAQVLALTGRNRARWSGKTEESRIFMEWLMNH